MTIWAQVAGRHYVSNGLTNCVLVTRGDALPLRAAIAPELSFRLGAESSARPEQIVVVSSIQEALDLTARVFLDPGDRVCVEHPGYIGASLTFAALGAMITRIPVDADGMVDASSSRATTTPDLRRTRRTSFRWASP